MNQLGIFDFLFTKEDNQTKGETQIQEKTEPISPQYKKVSFVTPDTTIPYYQWYESFVHYKEVRKIVHNFGLKYDVYKYSLFLNSTDFIHNYIKDHTIVLYGIKDSVPLCNDGSIDYRKIDNATQSLKASFNDEYDFVNTRLHNPWDFPDLDIHDEMRDRIDMLVDLFSQEGYDTSNTATARLIAESLKFDAILAAYHKYKDSEHNKYNDNSENSNNFIQQFFDDRYEELFEFLHEPGNDHYNDPALNYEKLAYISYVLYKQSSSLKFRSLENLYELILKKKESYVQESLLADNDPDEFKKSNEDSATEYSDTEANAYSTFSSVPDVDVVTPYELEQMVEEQYTSMGYEAIATKKSGDQGADVIVKEPSTGLVTVVQVKQYFDTKVGNKAVQEVLAGKEYYDADRAIVMTTNYFTKSATELAEKTDVELMDRDDFLTFMA